MSLFAKVLRALGLGRPVKTQSRPSLAQPHQSGQGSRLQMIENLKRQYPDQVKQWTSEPPVVTLWGDDPVPFVESLDADTLHELGCKLKWDDTARWFAAIAAHPETDHATLWNIYHLAAPEFYEAKMRENGGNREAFKGEDAGIVALLDQLVDRFRRGDIASKRFRMSEDFPVAAARARQTAARDAGTPLAWELPENAFVEAAGQDHAPRYEVVYGDLILPAFDTWLAARDGR